MSGPAEVAIPMTDAELDAWANSQAAVLNLHIALTSGAERLKVIASYLRTAESQGALRGVTDLGVRLREGTHHHQLTGTT